VISHAIMKTSVRCRNLRQTVCISWGCIINITYSKLTLSILISSTPVYLLYV